MKFIEKNIKVYSTLVVENFQHQIGASIWFLQDYDLFIFGVPLIDCEGR